MTSASKPPRLPSSSSSFSSKPPKNPSSVAHRPQIPNHNSIPNPNPNPNSNASPFPIPDNNLALTGSTKSIITMSPEDRFLSRATHLTRPELLRRRSHHLKKLSKIYKDHYWALMEDLKAQYREYYWRFGVSPIKDEENQANKRPNLGLEGKDANGDAVGSGGNVNNQGGNNLGKNYSDLQISDRCSFGDCKAKALALTSFCLIHILADNKQRLYKACTYVLKSSPVGPVTCGKIILRSAMPSLCNAHLLKIHRNVGVALRKAGVNVPLSRKLAPKFHVIVAEFVRQTQARRRAALKEDRPKTIVEEEMQKEHTGDGGSQCNNGKAWDSETEALH